MTFYNDRSHALIWFVANCNGIKIMCLSHVNWKISSLDMTFCGFLKGRRVHMRDNVHIMQLIG